MIEVQEFINREVKSGGEDQGWEWLETRMIQAIQMTLPSLLFIANLGKGRFSVAVAVHPPYTREKINLHATKLLRKMSAEKWKARIGVSEVERGLAGYREAFFQAQRSLKLMTKLAPGTIISFIGDWGISQYIADIPDERRKAFVDRMLKDKKPLDEELFHTLETFLHHDLHMAETSKKLHIHRNTLLYRLEKVKEIWGLNPRKFRDALVLQMLCWCLKLR